MIRPPDSPANLNLFLCFPLLYTGALKERFIELEEKELVIAFQSGEKRAFEQLVMLHRDRALRTAFLLCQNKDMAQDIVQESFVQCYMKLSKLKSPEAFRSWFYRILSRTAFGLMEKERRYLPMEELPEKREDVLEDDVFEHCARRESEGLLKRAILGLGIKQRTVIILYYFNQLSIEEIARVTGSLKGTVKSRLFFAREMLRKELLKQERETEEGERHEG